METDTETHRQHHIVLGRLAEKGGIELSKLEGSRTQEDPTESTSMGPWGLTGLNYQPKSMQWLDVGPIHVCNRCAAWSSCGFTNN